MIKGIFWGFLAQLAFALGLAFINQANFSEDQQLLKSNLILLFSASFSGLIVLSIFLANPESLSVLNQNWFYLLIGSFFLLVIGEYFLIVGISVSDITVVSLTALAFPVFALVVEFLSGKMFGQKIPIVTIHEIVGFFFIAIGFMIFTWKK